MKKYSQFITEAVALGRKLDDSINHDDVGQNLANEHQQSITLTKKNGKHYFYPTRNLDHPTLQKHEQVKHYKPNKTRDLQADQANRYFNQVKKRGF